jgi:phosphatidylglycerol lysyltransferase
MSTPDKDARSPSGYLRALTAIHRWRYWLYACVFLLIGSYFYDALHRILADMSYDAVAAEFRATSSATIFLAVLATGISYAALTGYDYTSLRYVKAQAPYKLIAQTSFIAYAITNTIGLGVLSGGTVRIRLYGLEGIDIGAISRAIAFNAVGFGLGIHTIGALAMLWRVGEIAPVVHLPVGLLQGGALLILTFTTGLILVCGGGGERRLPGGFTLRLPSAQIVMQQLIFSAVDIAASAAVLWLLIPSHSIDFTAFVGFYAIATVLGILSHLPGGIGVFEAVMLLALRGHMPMEAVAGALALYRLIYYLLPLVLALLLLLAHEIKRGSAAPVTRAITSLAPVLLSALTLVTGVMMLVSGSLPASSEASEILARYVPLPIVEASHFLGSVIGLALLFVARGMLLRLDASWWAGLVLILVSAVLAFPKGLAVSEAILLAFLAVALSLSKNQFTRKASLFSQTFTLDWQVAVFTVLASLTGLLFFAYSDVDYTHDLWWQFEFDGHVSRSLRAMVGVAILSFLFALRQLLQPAVKAERPDTKELERAAAIVQRQESPDASLALMGDKSFLFSDSGKAFVMFGRRGRSWISLFDPVGPEEEWSELIWRFIEKANDAGAKPSFYQVRPQALNLYLDAGLRLYKIGEEASVPLTGFSLKGGKRANLRHAVNRAERAGLTFEVVEVEKVWSVMGEISHISESWLAAHRASEKSFSLGAFEPTYVKRQPVAIVRNGGQAVAFATILTTGRKTVASVDIMRHLSDSPAGTMDFLFAKLMLYFQAQGYRRFNLGMAPLSGMAQHSLAPFWHRIGRLIYSRGEYFYNFRGLRAFKEKFDPEWEPRYLAASGGVYGALVALADITSLISGSVKGIIHK